MKRDDPFRTLLSYCNANKKLISEKKSTGLQPIGALTKKTMAIITSQSLFDWSQIENFGDLERLKLIFRHIPDEPLMRLLEKQRGYGVNKYPMRAVWNSILAGIVFGHHSIESLRRELSRSLLLAQAYGFNIFHGDAAIPSSGCYSRFMSKLAENHKELRKIFEVLLKYCYDNLDGFGENLAIDGKAIPSRQTNTHSLENRPTDLHTGGPFEC